ncbi:Fc.00g050560.m01.CDS01 [Cosmosporella sp. VM-42]
MSGEFTAFFYGTLMAPEVFFSVCYGDKKPAKAIRDMHTFTPAILEGYCRHRVQWADYPAIIAEEGHKVRGIYATGLTDANVDKLDYFEGSEYDKVKVEVKLLKQDGEKEVEGETKQTSVYVFNQPESLEKVEWDFEEFREQKMKLWTRGDWAFSEDSDDKAVERSAV